MRRTGRRHSTDYLEENEELQEIFEDYEDFDSAAEPEDVDSTQPQSLMFEEEPDKNSSAGRVWIKIGKVALVILILIGLFFASMKVTQWWIDRNQETESYGNDAPIYDDNSEDEPTEADDPADEPEEETEEEPEEEPEDEPSTQRPSTPGAAEPEDEPEDPSAPSTPSEPSEPAEPEEPSEPSTPTTPSEPSKPTTPSIVPGNPAA